MHLFLQSSIVQNNKTPCEIKIVILEADSVKLSEGSAEVTYMDKVSGGTFTEIVEPHKIFTSKLSALGAVYTELQRAIELVRKLTGEEFQNGSMGKD